jgi:MYXO-CTERM domain-containing protein
MACNDGGAQWIGCTDHAQCPEGQYCSERAVCACGGRDGGMCDDGGCHGCRAWVPWRSDGGDSCDYTVRFWCPAPTGTDASVDAGGGGTVDAGGGGGGGGGCTVRAPGERPSGSPLAVLAALIGVAALARVRRR